MYCFVTQNSIFGCKEQSVCGQNFAVITEHPTMEWCGGGGALQSRGGGGGALQSRGGGGGALQSRGGDGAPPPPPPPLSEGLQ